MNSNQIALNKFHEACTDYGILASTEDQEHYKRIWTRDLVISGIGALIINDEEGIASFKEGLEFIAKYQSEDGLTPSNASKEGKVSYGTLTGKTDVLAWYIIGVGKYVQFIKDEDFLYRHQANIEKALMRMKMYEFNNRGLMYLPMDSNWADEYIFSGYVLLDNVLRLWAYQILQNLNPNDEYQNQIDTISNLIINNFKKVGANNESVYQFRLNQMQLQAPYSLAAFNPARYFEYFDTMANSVLIMMDLDNDASEVLEYSEKLRTMNSFKNIPAHSPVIHPGDADWGLLENNYLHHFENETYCYHNGGLWPMLQMIYSWGLLKNQKNQEIEEVYKGVCKLNHQEQYSYREYYHALTGEGKGVKNCTWNIMAELVLSNLLTKNFSELFPEFE